MNRSYCFFARFNLQLGKAKRFKMEKRITVMEDPENNTNMLSEVKLKALQELISNATAEELAWMNGYLSGIISHQTAKQEINPAKTV